MKVVINACYGGFSLSPKALELYWSKKGKKIYWFASGRPDFSDYIPIDDPENHFVPIPCFTKEWNDKKTTSTHLDVERNDPTLVEVVEEMGQAANGTYAELSIVEIPDDVEWEIEEYDGIEWVAEKHRTWR